MGSLLGAVNIYLITYVLATFNFGDVQSFVTDLAYGTILVLSLLLTVVLPHLRGVIRNISPLLFFVLLSLIALGVIIHATYDYSAPGATAAAAGSTTGLVSLSAPAAPAAPAAAEKAAGIPTPTLSPPFIFETSPTDAAVTGPTLVTPLAMAGMLILAVLIILRTSVAQAGARRTLSPLIYIVVTGVVLLVVYLASGSVGASSHDEKAGMPQRPASAVEQ
jgi:ribose transport system permease protein